MHKYFLKTVFRLHTNSLSQNGQAILFHAQYRCTSQEKTLSVSQVNRVVQVIVVIIIVIIIIHIDLQRLFYNKNMIQISMCKRYVRTLQLHTKFEMLIQILSKFSLTNKKIKRQCVPHFQRLTFLSNPISKYQILCTNTTAWVVLGDITLFFVRLFFLELQ